MSTVMEPPRVKAKQNRTGSVGFLAAAAFLAGGLIWWKKFRGQGSQSSKPAEVPPATKPRATPSARGAPKAGNRKKKGKAAKAEEKERRAEKRDKHAKEAPPPAKHQEDDGNNELYTQSTYYVGGRKDRVTDAFGGKAIVK